MGVGAACGCGPLRKSGTTKGEETLNQTHELQIRLLNLLYGPLATRPHGSKLWMWSLVSFPTANAQKEFTV